MIDRTWSDELVFHKNRRRHWTLVQNVETHANQVLSVALGKVGHGSYKASLGLAECRSSLPRSVLPHDGAILRSTRLLKSAQGSKSAGIVDAPHHHMPGTRRTQMSAHR